MNNSTTLKPYNHHTVNNIDDITTRIFDMDDTTTSNNSGSIHQRRSTVNNTSTSTTQKHQSPKLTGRRLYTRPGNSNEQTISKQQHQQRYGYGYITPCNILSHIIVGVITFQIGFNFGSHNESGCMYTLSNMYTDLTSSYDDNTKTVTNKNMTTTIFPNTISNLIYGTSLIERTNFIEQYDIGVPWNEPKSGATDVLLLYQSSSSLPNDYYNKYNNYNNDESSSSTTTNDDDNNNIHQSPFRVSYNSATDATKNCHSMKVVLMEPNTRHECIAIVPQWESFHVHHYLRIKPSDKSALESTSIYSNISSVVPPPHFHVDYPLSYVSRVHTLSGKAIPKLPLPYQSKFYFPMLIDYLTKLPHTLERLKPIAEKAAVGRVTKSTAVNNDGIDNDRKTIVIMVCNFGQSELLMNFLCSARANNIDISNVLLFATDQETSILAKSYNMIHVFDVKDAFGDNVPMKAAKVYGDRTFRIMMLSKVYCVHLINALGYDVLFQDVDVVWYHNPLHFFHNQQLSGNYDIYFQDDGAHSTRYTPYSPNSGFYYVRFNDRTRHFFEVFMRMGESIIASGSHQSVMNGLLAEHASSTGLLVKVYDRDSYLGQEFPGGFHYHKRREFMKKIIKGERSPYIFHMSWTENKENKRKFYQQLGNWYLNEQCIDKSYDEIDIPKNEDSIATGISNFCCSAQAIVKCHYADKPSKTSCKGSPLIDKRWGSSFW